MKSYNHLWEKFISEDNIVLAIKRASINKKDRPEVIKALKDSKLVQKIKYYAEHFENKKHTPIQIYDGIQRKKRWIIVPTFMELVIQHMIINILGPILQEKMYYHSYGSLPKKGGHRGKKSIERYINRHPELSQWCLKFDIRHYFASVSKHILMNKLKRLIHDKKFLNIIFEILNAVENGIPLGFYLSQWLANFFLTDFDHLIKRIIKKNFYIRYMDDIVIFAKSKEYLKILLNIIKFKLNKIKLKIKNDWQIFKISSNKKDNGKPLDFMGFKFYRTRTVLRKSLMIKCHRKFSRASMENKLRIHTIRQLFSYNGWIKYADMQEFTKKHINNIIDFKKCKQRISNYDKRMNNVA